MRLLAAGWQRSMHLWNQARHSAEIIPIRSASARLAMPFPQNDAHQKNSEQDMEDAPVGA